MFGASISSQPQLSSQPALLSAANSPGFELSGAPSLLDHSTSLSTFSSHILSNTTTSTSEELLQVQSSSPEPDSLEAIAAFREGALRESFVSHLLHVRLVWRDLTYSVPVKTRQGLFRGQRTTTRVILNKVSGYVRSGQLLGIIGTSGSGKTTLLNILARRLAPGRGSKLKGELLLNGEPYRRRFRRSLLGSYPNTKRMYPTLTAREQIGFAVRLACQPITHRDRLLDALGLVSSQDTLVGDDVIRGLSGGERRRVGVALALAPPVPLLILDEPTTGLDSFNSLTLIRLLHRIAKGGRAVIVTVHQPRTDIFSLFDSLLILTCGESAYFGPASEAVDFFQTLGHICPLGVNFADFLIDTATVDERMDNVDSSKERVRQIVSEYRTSDYGRLARLDLCGSGDESPETSRSLPGGEAVGAVSSHTSTASETSKLMVPDSSTDDFAKLTSSSTPVLGLPASQEPEDLSLSDLTITCHRAPDPCDVNTELLRRHQRLVWPHQVLVVAHRGLLNYFSKSSTPSLVRLFPEH